MNPWFLDMDDLIDKGFIFISKTEKLGITIQDKDHFNFEIADDLSKKLGDLLLAWSSQSEERKLEFNKWISKNPWVDDYSKFIVIRSI